LQRPHAVALHGVRHFAAAAMLAALELPGNAESLVLHLKIRLGRGPQEPPVLLVRGDDRLAEGVDLIDPIEPLQGLEGQLQIVAHLPRVGVGIQRQLAKPLVGIFEVPCLKGLLQPLAHRVLRRGLHSPRTRNAHEHHSCRHETTKQFGHPHFGHSLLLLWKSGSESCNCRVRQVKCPYGVSGASNRWTNRFATEFRRKA
jgi:hypothetical protein